MVVLSVRAMASCQQLWWTPEEVTSVIFHNLFLQWFTDELENLYSNVRGLVICSWQVSKVSEKYIGLKNKILLLFLYTYHIWHVTPHFSSAGTVLHNVGGVKSQPFLKH